MADGLVTFHMHGATTLAQFRDALDRFHELAEAIAAEVAPDQPFEWVIEELEAGSAKAAFATVTERPEYGAEVRRGITDALEAGQSGKVIPFGPRAMRATRGVLRLVGDQASEGLDIETDFGAIDVPAPVLLTPTVNRRPVVSFGMVKGEVDAATRSRSRFVVLVEPDRRPVPCTLDRAAENDPLLFRIFGRRVRVRGEISRDRTSGRLIRVRTAAENVELLTDERPSFERALGVIRIPRGYPPPEERRAAWGDDG